MGNLSKNTVESALHCPALAAGQTQEIEQENCSGIVKLEIADGC